jgi:hypothetical protein
MLIQEIGLNEHKNFHDIKNSDSGNFNVTFVSGSILFKENSESGKYILYFQSSNSQVNGLINQYVE